MMQPSDVEIQIEVAVMKEKIENIEDSINGLRQQIEDVETRVMRIERTVYMLLGGLIIIQALPMLSELLSL